jgi:ATP-dependent DNA helicase RecQ
MPQIHEVLKQYWGFDKFRPLQEEIITSVLQGHDTLALLPTGGGKSLCFQVPALVQEGLCLVISPLIALMKDQVKALEQKGIRAAAVYTGMGYRQIDNLLDACVYSDYKFLYISPERLMTDEFQTRMERMKISLLAVDEAHCISQWGYDFRPPYLKIAEVRDKLKRVPVIALTATATPQVVDDIQSKLHFKQPNVFKKSFVRKSLSYVVRQATNKNKALLEILGKVPGSAIVYVRSRKKTKEFADLLNKHQLKADFYHAGLDPLQRSLRQDNWMNNKTRIICCTNAFGMGIDKPDVRLVLHLDLAESLEAYFQEAGRAGRDESKSYAVQLLDEDDLYDMDRKLQDGFPSIDLIRNIYDALCLHFRIAYQSGAGRGFDFDLRGFAESVSISNMRVQGVLKILEQQELIYITSSLNQTSQIKVIADKDVLHRFQTTNAKLEPLVKFILRTSEGVFEDYVSLEEEAFASRLKLSVADIAAQLTMLEKFGIVSYKPRSEKPQIIFLKNRVKKEELLIDRQFIKQRKDDFENRLKAVKFYVTESSICRNRVLVNYFGEEPDADCGTCDICLEKKRKNPAATQFTQTVQALEKELKTSPLTMDELKTRLNINATEFKQALDFLLDHGKIKRTATAGLQWVD